MPLPCLQACLQCQCSGWYHTPLCANCQQTLPYIEQACRQCASPLYKHQTQCGQCLTQTPQFEHTIASFHYQGRIKQMIIQLKYQQQYQQAVWLADLWWQRCHTIIEPVDLIVPIPLHRQRIRQRGYNQAALLCKQFSRLSGIPYNLHALTKIQLTVPQNSLNAAQRKTISHKAFASQNVNNIRVALIDDVMTTGSTLNAASECLKRNGAQSIHCWVIARA